MMTNKSSFSRYFMLLFCFICGALYLAFQGGKVAGMLFAMMNVLIIYLIAGRWSGIRKPEIVSRQLLNYPSDEVEAGTALSFAVELKIPGNLPIPYVIVKDQLQREQGDIREFEASFIPDWKRRGTVSYQTPPLQRGVYSFVETTCTTEDVFGLLEHSGSATYPQTIKVLPRTVTIRYWHDYHVLAKGGKHQFVSAQAWRESTQINGVRDYVYGDRISRIHWNASARTGEWKSKEFERESLPTLLVVLDAQSGAYESHDMFETAVSTAASFIKFARKNDLSYGLLTTGKQVTYIPPATDEHVRTQVSHHLISVACDGSEPIEVVLQQALPQMTHPLIVLISPVHSSQCQSIFKQIRVDQAAGFHVHIRSQGMNLDQHDKQDYVSFEHMYSIANVDQLPAVLGGRRR